MVRIWYSESIDMWGEGMIRSGENGFLSDGRLVGNLCWVV